MNKLILGFFCDFSKIPDWYCCYKLNPAYKNDKENRVKFRNFEKLLQNSIPHDSKYVPYPRASPESSYGTESTGTTIFFALEVLLFGIAFKYDTVTVVFRGNIHSFAL